MKIFQKFQSHVNAGGFSRDLGAFSSVQLQTIIKGIVCLILQCVYLFHVANTPRQYLDSIFMTTAGFLVFISFVSMVSKTTEVFKLIDNIEQTINERLKYAKSMEYAKTNDLVELISEILHFIMVYLSAPGFVLPKAMYCLCMYFTTESGADAFELPFPTWIPFDWKNPIGYSTAVVLQLSIVAYTFYYMSTFSSLAIGSYLFSPPIVEEVNEMIKSHNDSLKTSPSRTQMMKQFTEIIRIIYFKQIFFDFFGVFQISFVVLFLGCTGAICLAMMMTQLQMVQVHHEIDPIVLFESLFCGFWALALVFLACEFCQRISNSYDTIGDAINAIDWYLIRPDERQMHTVFLICLIYTKKPLECKFFGSISCSRERFKRVIYKAYNGFMVLRTLYK